MKTRKLVLIIADAVLLLIFAIQLILSARSTTKTFKNEKEITSISITNKNQTFEMNATAGNWACGPQNYPVNNADADSMVQAINKLNSLEKVASGSNEVILDRYDLTEGKCIKVCAKSNNDVVRTIYIGKTAATNSQVYAMVDDSKDILLLTGNLRKIFDKTIDTIRSKTLLNYPEESVKEIKLTSASGKEVVKTTDMYGFTNITATVWHEKDEDLGGKEVYSVIYKIDDAAKQIKEDISMTVYEIPAESEGKEPVYYAKCSTSPYTFEFSPTVAKRYLELFDEKQAGTK